MRAFAERGGGIYAPRAVRAVVPALICLCCLAACGADPSGPRAPTDVGRALHPVLDGEPLAAVAPPQAPTGRWAIVAVTVDTAGHRTLEAVASGDPETALSCRRRVRDLDYRGVLARSTHELHVICERGAAATAPAEARAVEGDPRHAGPVTAAIAATPGVRRCHREALDRGRWVMGTVDLALVVGEGGALGQTHVVSNQTGDRDLGQCLAAAIDGRVADPPPPMGARFRFPFTFEREPPVDRLFRLPLDD